MVRWTTRLDRYLLQPKHGDTPRLTNTPPQKHGDPSRALNFRTLLQTYTRTGKESQYNRYAQSLIWKQDFLLHRFIAVALVMYASSVASNKSIPHVNVSLISYYYMIKTTVQLNMKHVLYIRCSIRSKLQYTQDRQPIYRVRRGMGLCTVYEHGH